MVNLSGWHSVLALESLVTDGWEVHVSSFLGDLDSLEPVQTQIIINFEIHKQLLTRRRGSYKHR